MAETEFNKVSERMAESLRELIPDPEQRAKVERFIRSSAMRWYRAGVSDRQEYTDQIDWLLRRRYAFDREVVMECVARVVVLAVLMILATTLLHLSGLACVGVSAFLLMSLVFELIYCEARISCVTNLLQQRSSLRSEIKQTIEPLGDLAELVVKAYKVVRDRSKREDRK